MMSMFWSTAMMASAAIGAHARLTCSHRRRSQVGAGNAEPGEGENGADDQPHGLFADEADPDGAVVAGSLEHPTKDGEQQIQAARGDAERCRPSLVLDADGVGDGLAEEHREDAHHQGEDEDRPGPATGRGREPGSDAEMAENGLTGGGDLHCITGHREDEKIAHERRQRPIVVTEQAGEDDGRAQGDDVVGHHRSCEP
jgi:hypothetical protein